MLCSNCGKDVPYTGKVCPYCHTEKAHDQKLQQQGAAGFAGLFLGWMIGWMASGVVAGFICGFVGLCLGVIAFGVANRKPKK